MEFFNPKANYDFLARRRPAIVGSAVLIVIAVASFVVRGMNYGIDFTGGTLVEVSYENPIAIDEIRDTLADGGFDDAQVQFFGTSRDVLVRLPQSEEENAAEQSGRLMESLRAPIGEQLTESAEVGLQQCVPIEGGQPLDCVVQMRRVEFVGPQVGDELKEQGGLAMLYAMIGILIYVTWRFEWRFALGSVVALIHDVLITVGFFSVFGIEFSLSVLAAVLAVIGYSLNDTIVIFDRVRENFRRMRRADPVEIMNVSVNQTMPRTILTSGTTLIVVVTLLLFGGPVISGFSLALLIGIIAGTYSTIFIANPAVLALGISREHMVPVKKEGAEADMDALP